VLQSQGGEEYPANSKKMNDKWVGYSLRRNLLLRHVIEAKIEGRSDRSTGKKT
jgi:hypothetical protein